MELVLGWLIASVVVGIIASSRGRSGFGWFLLTCLISPVLTLILVLVLPAVGVPNAAAPSPETHVKCPDCRELVLRDARKCKHCGTGLIPQ